jgi:hypothetical protein
VRIGLYGNARSGMSMPGIEVATNYNQWCHIVSLGGIYEAIGWAQLRASAYQLKVSSWLGTGKEDHAGEPFMARLASSGWKIAVSWPVNWP